MHFTARCVSYFVRSPPSKGLVIMYPQSTVERVAVSAAERSWDVSLSDSEYSPSDYTAPVVLRKPVWADISYNDMLAQADGPKYNQIDKSTGTEINRISHTGNYEVRAFLPLNPSGRTGIKGRGLLGRWGPNHAADPIVTRWKRNATSNEVELDDVTKKPILQFVSIQRKDSGEWAIPGGMVDPGEKVSLTLKREFGEEALNTLELSDEEKEELQQLINEVFSHGELIFKGIVDDPRNTDNAWMETIAMNFHDDDGTSVGKLQLCSGDDASSVRWTDINRGVSLYASHLDIVSKVVTLRSAHW